MIGKLLSVLKTLGWKCRYGRRIRFDGILRCERRTTIRIRRGEIAIGNHVQVRCGTYIAAVKGGRIAIGQNVFMNRNCSLVCQEAITIGDGCAFGPNVTAYDHNHRFDRHGIQEGYDTAPIVVEKNCWIGAGVILLRGTHVGEGSVIGAGTVVKGEIPPHSIVTCEGNRHLHIVPIEAR